MGYGTTFKNFIQNAVNNKSYNKRLYAGQVSEELAMVINKLYPQYKVDNFLFIINSREINHSINKHGVENVKKDEIPVTKEDLLLIPEILNNPDNISKSPYKDFSNRDALFFEKIIGDNARIVMGIAKRKNALIFDTFYKIDKQKRKGRVRNDHGYPFQEYYITR